MQTVSGRMKRPRMDSPAVARALSLGLKRAEVENAIEQRIKVLWSSYKTKLFSDCFGF